MAKEITVTIAGGKAIVATQGYQGAACKDATRELEKVLGMKESDETTPEFHEKEQQVITN